MLNDDIERLDQLLARIDSEWGGDVEFRMPITEFSLDEMEKKIDFKLPEIFRWFYTKKTNGIKIDNKSVLGVYDEKNKKTFVENIERFNNPENNLYFKGRSHIFKDYLIIGYDFQTLICLSKKYDFDNPLLYACSDSNNSKEVNFCRVDFNLCGIIEKMLKDSFEFDEDDDYTLK